MSNNTRREFVKAAIVGPAAFSLVGQSLATETERRPIKVGQIGTKHAHAEGHFKTLHKYPDVFDVVGIVEPDAAQRERVKREDEFRGAHWISEEELLSVDGLQAVAVETEVSQLLATAQRCVDVGLHVHVDKPAGDSYADLVKLHASARQKGLTIQMGYMFRYNPAFQFMFQAVREGWLGRIFEIDCVMSKKVGVDSRRRLAGYPGGSMFELGCHLLDPLLHIMGEPEQTTGYLRHTRPDLDNLADNTLAVLEYPTTTCTVRSALVEVDGGDRRQFIVCGDGGTIVIRPLEPPRLELTLEEDTADFHEGTQLVTLTESPGRYDGTWLDFARVIRKEKAHDFSHEHDLAVQRTLLKACQMPLS